MCNERINFIQRKLISDIEDEQKKSRNILFAKFFNGRVESRRSFMMITAYSIELEVTVNQWVKRFGCVLISLQKVKKMTQQYIINLEFLELTS